MPDRLAPEDWIGYVIAWPAASGPLYHRARKVAVRYFAGLPDPLDLAGEAAITGLLRAIRATNRRDGSVPEAYLDRCVITACGHLRLKTRRRSGLLTRRPFDPDHPAATCEPWQIAAIREEVLTRGTDSSACAGHFGGRRADRHRDD